MVDVVKAIARARVVQQFSRVAITVAAVVLLRMSSAHAQQQPFLESPIRCGGTDDHPAMLERKDLDVGRGQPDLEVNGTCLADQSLYMFRQVNIINNGKLKFIEPAKEATDKTTNLPITGQDFWATAIIIESGGAILAGVDDQKPYGTNHKTLTFHLWGADPRKVNNLKPTDPEGPGVSCVPIPTNVTPEVADCGIPKEAVWDTDGSPKLPMPGKHFPGQEKDYFYKYTSLHGDDGVDPVTKQKGHFGYKVLALSYGGTLRLHGAKGATTTPAEIETLLKSPDATSQADDNVLTDSGASWRRLAGGGAKDSSDLTLDRSVRDNWKDGDEVVVTTTDFFPNHSESRQLKGDSSDTKVTLRAGLTYAHADEVYDIRTKVGAKDESGQPKVGDAKERESAFRTAIAERDGNEKFLQAAETRAAVALLTRSIRIVSEGDKPGDTLKDATDGREEDTTTKRPAVAADPHYQYGGQVIFRQGFQQLQIQGVEFKQLGQGGFLGRYPVHFHIARRVPSDTYVIDSSVNESMTRWFVIHSTLGVTLARNVGYKSIGHGYFLEDATEIDNKLYSNLGVYARAPVADSADNPRQISGLLDARNAPQLLPLKYHSDSQYPSVFWITNGWNSFVGNMAAGAGTCGACYWVVPAGNHDMKDTSPNNMMEPMAWDGYAAIQAASAAQGGSTSNARAGLSPVRLFYKNYCSTAEHSISITDGSTCTQVQQGNVQIVKNPRAPDAQEPEATMASKMYYPRYTGNRKTAFCNPASPDTAADSCRKVECNFPNPQYCAPTILSYYTTAFHWAETNFSAIWMRTGYLAVDHVFMSDIQGPGVTMVTGGDYTRSNLPVGYWGLVANSIFVGETQAKNADNSNWIGGPTSCNGRGNVCTDKQTGIAFPLSSWGTGQRMYNVYDGPAYEDAVAYLDIHPTLCNDSSNCIYWNKLGVRRALTELKIPGGGTIPAGQGYLPNAGIGWKQSNGFYYPPAFHSQNLFFDGVDIRHYVVSPITFPGVYRTDALKAESEFAHDKGNYKIFNPSFSDVDRQTELSDDDGSLTGFKQTVIVNEDPFFRAPVQTSQCRSNVGVDGDNACRGEKPPTTPTARTSPYDHLTTALYPAEGSSEWGSDCTNGRCTGVPIYRQYLTGTKGADAASSTREWATWKTEKCDARFAALHQAARPVATWNPYRTPYDPPPKPTPIVDPKTMAIIQNYLSFEAQCPAPFVRMAGMNLGIGQRSVLTVNHGLYFIETTRSANYQKTSPEIEEPDRFLSVFRPGQSYYVFFLFAKNGMKQSYQIYGGPSFKDTDITGVRMNVTGSPTPQDANWKMPWSVHPAKDGDGKLVPGVMQVDVDFDPKMTGIDLDPKKLEAGEKVMDETCQPHTFCSKTGGTCGCDASKLDILGKLNPKFENVCKNICGHWAVKDLDCPKGGCLGFKFKLANDFVADDKVHRPPPSAYPATVVDGTPLLRTGTLPDKETNKGGCYYAKIPSASEKPDNTCKVAD